DRHSFPPRRSSDLHQLARHLLQADVLDIESIFIDAEHAVIALIGIELALCDRELLTELLDLLIEPRGLSTRRVDLQLEARLDVGRADRVSETRRRLRVVAPVGDLDEVAVDGARSL